MIKIVIPVSTVEDAIDLRDRLRSTIIRREEGDMATVGWGGIIVHTNEPLRMISDLVSNGFIENRPFQPNTN